MKYLVTGSAGFIGTNLINYLKSLNHEVVGIDYPLDLCDLIPGHTNIDIIIHLAAETNVRQSIIAPKTTFLRNCKSTIHILETARANNAKFVFASSCGAKDSKSSYAASKLAGEAICKAYRESYDLSVSILRLSNVYGPHSIHKDSVIAKFIKSYLDNKPLQVYGDGHQSRDFIYVDDVCDSIYNCTTDMNVSTGNLVSINSLIELLNFQSEVEHLPALKGEIFRPDIQTNIQTKFNLAHGTRLTLDWFKKNYRKSDN